MVFSSQYINIKNEEWKNKGCSISSLWMALKSLKSDFNLSVDELLEEAIKINSFNENGFWKHEKIAILSHNYGLPAYAEEFKSIPFGIETEYSDSILNYGVEKIFNFVKNKEGYVIVSVPKNFDSIDKPHSILIHDFIERDNKRYFVYSDSEKLSKEEGENLEIDLEEFKNKWRKLAIFINRICIF